MKKVSIAGVGMDGAKTLTAQALGAVRDADVIIGAKRVTDMFKNENKPVFASADIKKIAEYIKSCGYEKIAALVSGDCGFYSGAQKIAELIPDCEVNIICGISSPSYFCAKLKIPWQNAYFVSLHGRGANIARAVAAHEKTFFLLGGSVTAADVCKRLCEYGLNGVTVYTGENLASENERILSGTAEEMTEIKTDKLCVMLAVNRGYEKYIKSAIADGEFIRGAVPMTKAHIRGACAAGLKIAKNDIVWDVGAGTGSVSVEAAIRCFEGTVYAVEKNAEAAELIEKNRRKFKCDNIIIINGTAPDALRELPAPDAVFIGGSGKDLRGIIAAAVEKNAAVKITAAAVSLETLGACTELFSEYGFETEITQLAVTRTKRIGSHTMLTAENPVFIIRRGGRE